MSLPYTPVVNAGLLYVNGLNLAYVSAKVLSVKPGAARDVTDSNDIILDALNPYVVANNGVLQINGAVGGQANGVDVSPIVASSLYAVYVIASSTSVQSTANQLAGGPSPNPLGPSTVPAPLNPFPVACLLSLNGVQPTLPLGYDMYRRIGWVSTDNAANLAKFYQYGAGQDRWYYWDVGSEVLAAGTSASFANVALNATVAAGAGIAGVPVPPEAVQVQLDVALSAAATVQFLPYGSTATNGIVRYESSAAAIIPLVVPAQLNVAVPTVQYKVSAGNATLLVTGFQDVL